VTKISKIGYFLVDFKLER